MMAFDSYVDDFYCNMNLSTEMPLPAARETILGFFERVQKSFPMMRNFYTRETGDTRARILANPAAAATQMPLAVPATAAR